MTKLKDVVNEMETLIEEKDEQMERLLNYLKEENFHDIARCLRKSEDFVDVTFIT